MLSSLKKFAWNGSLEEVVVVFLLLVPEAGPGRKRRSVPFYKVRQLDILDIVCILSDSCFKVNVLEKHLDLFDFAIVVMDLLLKAFLLLSVGVHLLSKGCLGHTLLQEVVVREEDFKFLLLFDQATVLGAQLVSMVSAVIEVELLETDATETDGESLVGLGVQLHWFDISATHLAHQTD